MVKATKTQFSSVFTSLYPMVIAGIYGIECFFTRFKVVHFKTPNVNHFGEVSKKKY